VREPRGRANFLSFCAAAGILMGHATLAGMWGTINGRPVFCVMGSRFWIRPVLAHGLLGWV
jgi:hypothetical protein